jgi:hypothetical protein
MMNNSLFLVGEIGGNDYNNPFQSLMPFEMIQSFTPSVIEKISSTITVSHFAVLLFLPLQRLLFSQV